MAKKQKDTEGENEKVREKREFRVISPLLRDGTLYKIGDVEEFELTEGEELKLIGQSLEEVG